MAKAKPTGAAPATDFIGRLVAVTWRDAQGDATAQMGREDIASARSFVFTSYGILVRDDRDQQVADPVILVAHEQGEDGSYRGVTVVPCEMVVTVEDLGTRTLRLAPNPVQQVKR